MLLFIRICRLRVELYNSVAIFFTQGQSQSVKVTDKVVKLLLIESFKISVVYVHTICYWFVIQVVMFVIKYQEE